MNKKTVTCITHSPLAVYRRFETRWDDVWLRLWDRRKRVYLGPTVCGSQNLRDECECEQSVEPDGERVKLLRSCQEQLNAGAFLAVEPGNDGIDTLYVNKELLTRKDVERALEEYLHGLGFAKGPVRFRWKRPKTKVFVLSM